LKAVFDNPQNILWPNAFVKARLHIATRRKAVVMPTAAIQRGPQGTFVYVATAEATAVARPVEIALTQGEIAVVAKGVNVGDQIVVEGQAQLRPGAKIAAKPAPASLASGSASGSPASGAGDPGGPPP
jgi:multidrug efflux system membrane fusion protein